MRTVRTKVYKFDELSTEAKSVAIVNERNDYNNYGEPLTFFTDHCQDVLKNKGFGECKLQYRLSCSQGDGLSFKTSTIDIERFIKQSIPNVKKSVLNALKQLFEWKITGNTGRYTYPSKKDVNFEQTDYNFYCPNLCSLAQQISGDIATEYFDTCNELENEGYSWIESENEDETITERLINNDTEYTVDGKIFNA